jgi:predicted amidophosphoribosyltransferase
MLKGSTLYKYKGALWIEPMLAEILTTTIQKDLNPSEWDSVIPVPLHFVKYNERGFNQAERLSISISKATAIPVNKNVLKRIKYTETQTALNRQSAA